MVQEPRSRRRHEPGMGQEPESDIVMRGSGAWEGTGAWEGAGT